MIPEETINEFIRDTINTIIGTPGFAIKAKDNGPRPIGPYADVDFLADLSIGWEQKEQEDSGLDVSNTIMGAREITFSIGFYRDSAKDNARKVRTAFNRQTVYESLFLAKLGLVARSEVRDVSERLEENWEERAQFDLTLSAVGSDEEIIRAIQFVTIDGEFQTRGKSIPISVEVNT